MISFSMVGKKLDKSTSIIVSMTVASFIDFETSSVRNLAKMDQNMIFRTFSKLAVLFKLIPMPYCLRMF